MGLTAPAPTFRGGIVAVVQSRSSQTPSFRLSTLLLPQTGTFYHLSTAPASPLSQGNSDSFKLKEYRPYEDTHLGSTSDCSAEEEIEPWDLNKRPNQLQKQEKVLVEETDIPPPDGEVPELPSPLPRDKIMSILRSLVRKPMPSTPLPSIFSPRRSKEDINGADSSSPDQSYILDADSTRNQTEKSPTHLVVHEEEEEIVILRHFIVLFSSPQGEKHLSISIDINSSVFSAIQRILEVAKARKIYPSQGSTEFGLFLPSFAPDRILTQDQPTLEESSQKAISGGWANNDLPLSQAIILTEFTAPILFIQPRDTPRKILLHILPPADVGLSQPNPTRFRTFEVSLPQTGEAIMVANSSCTVAQAILSIRNIIQLYRPEALSLEDQNVSCLVLERTRAVLQDPQNLIEEMAQDLNFPIDTTHKPRGEDKLIFYFNVSEVTSLHNTFKKQIPNPLKEELDEKELALMRALKLASGSLQPHLLPGEAIQATFQNCKFSFPPHPPARGTLLITNFQLILISINRSTYFSTNADAYIPLTSILRSVEFGKDAQAYTGFHLECKNAIHISCSVEGQKNISQFYSAIGGLRSISQTFAFANREHEAIYANLLDKPPSARQMVNGWEIYEPIGEYERLGLVERNGWRLSFANNRYQLCNSYPSCFVVPKNCNEELVKQVAAFRSKQRIPATVWRNNHNGATLTRCAQPLIGLRILKNSRSIYDESLIQMIRENNTMGSSLCLVDCRPLANAKANQLLKGGFEDITLYQDCTLKFLKIENIHKVRESFYKMLALCKYENYYSSPQWLTRLEATSWLQTVASVLKGACSVAKLLDKGNSVVVHCSDGWDRTPQVCALAQFLLDPYYRTIIGFEVLIEKEWMSFGHMFATRLGHLRAKRDEGNESPIFLVFIECIWQILQQFPCIAEFNESLLLFIMDHTYSCRFGSFLVNCAQEKNEEYLVDRTTSIWTSVNASKRKYVNAFYQPHDQLVSPNFAYPSLRLWERYYLRFVTRSATPDTPQSVMNQMLDQNEELRNSLASFHTSMRVDEKDRQ